MDNLAIAKMLNERFVRPDLIELFERFEAGEAEAVLAEFAPLIERLDPAIVWDATELKVPDVPNVSHGVEGVIEFFRAWLAAWDDFSWTTKNYEVQGDDVIYDIDITAEKKGLLTEMHASHVMTFRDGRLAVWRFTYERPSGPDM